MISVRLEEVLEQVSRREEVNSDQQYRILGAHWYAKGLYVKAIEHGTAIQAQHLYRVEEGDFVYNRLFAWKGAFAVVTHEQSGCFVSGEFPCFRADEMKLSPKYLWLFFSQAKVWNEALGLSSGGTPTSRNRLKVDRLLQMTIPLPPLPEQQRIVARIEALAGKIEAARGLRGEAAGQMEKLQWRMMKSAFEHYGEPRTTIGDVFEVTNGGTPSRDHPEFWEGDIRWVSSGEVAFRRINDTKERITELGLKHSSAKLCPPNTVLIAMIGQGKTRGQCAILDCSAATNQNVAAIHVYKTNHLADYVFWWLYAQYFESRLTETGTAQPALNAKRIREMRLPLPSIQKQCKLVAFLEALSLRFQELKQSQSYATLELDALLPAVLDRAFKGEL